MTVIYAALIRLKDAADWATAAAAILGLLLLTFKITRGILRAAHKGFTILDEIQASVRLVEAELGTDGGSMRAQLTTLEEKVDTLLTHHDTSIAERQQVLTELQSLHSKVDKLQDADLITRIEALESKFRSFERG